MAGVIQGLFGGAKSAVTSVASAGFDDAFADFATPPSPAAPAHAASSAFGGAAHTPAAAPGGFAASLFSPAQGMQGRPYTKWYRVWERVTIEDFYQEMFIVPLIIVLLLVHVWGSRANKKRAQQWAAAHLPVLESEYALVGFGKKAPATDDVQSQGLAKAMASNMKGSDEALRQKGKNEYITYATGRQNVAYLDLKLTLHKRYNPFHWLGEVVLSFFFDSVAPPVERMEATALCFDGKEKALLPDVQGVKDSSFDGFVWAIVHKDKMKELRDERYDLSLTTTRDSPKLPDWATTMTESAEVSDVMLTPELLKAVNEIGEDLEALIISDQPIDAPKKLNDTIPRKRVSLSVRLSSSTSTSLPLFQYFLRLPDQLASAGHFRPEALRKIRATRDEEMRKIRRVDEEEKAEERRLAGDKAKKEDRDRKLSRMGAEEQKKFLEKEREMERKKGMKKKTMKA